MESINNSEKKLKEDHIEYLETDPPNHFDKVTLNGLLVARENIPKSSSNNIVLPWNTKLRSYDISSLDKYLEKNSGIFDMKDIENLMTRLKGQENYDIDSLMKINYMVWVYIAILS